MPSALLSTSWRLSAVLMAAALSACSGGGSGAVGGLSPSPTPATAPPPTYDTAEYRANYGLDAINAIAAYEDGLSGQGVTVAVIDTGIDLDHPDLNANISPHSVGISAGTYAAANDADAEGHGTAVAGVIAAERNGSGMHGVAFDATLLAINASDPATCPGECEFAQSALADAIDYAKNRGAKIINLSLGGAAAGQSLQNAMQGAVEAGVIIVISAGNDGAAVPSELAQIASAGWADGRILIAGAVDANNLIADFSDRAGDAFKSLYVVAPGVSVRTTGVGGGQVIATGTSFSTPHVVGALALLAELFPNLSAHDLAEIILTTAHDLGEPGIDAIYGRGIIDLDAAIQPLGVTGIPTAGGIVPAAADTPALAATALSLSPAFGDALAGHAAFANAMALDGYRRSYRFDLNRLTARSDGSRDLLSLIDSRRYGMARRETVAPGVTLSYAAARDGELDRLIDAAAAEKPRLSARLGLERAYADGSRLALFVNDPAAALGGDSTAGVFLQRQSLAFGLLEDDSVTAHAERPWGLARLGLTSSFSRIEDSAGPLAGGSRRLAMASAALALGSKATVGLGLGLLQENGLVLGSRSAGALSLGEGATTRLLDGRLTWAARPDVFLFAHGVIGRTSITGSGGSLLRPAGDLIIAAAELGALWRGAFHASDVFGLQLSLPPRIEAGCVVIGQIIGRDYAADRLQFAQTAAPLSPSGREVDIEAAYALSLIGDATLQINASYVIDPGHRAEASDAVSLLVSLSRAF